MDKGILLRTKTLVILIRHYIRDLSGVFPVCHYGPMVAPRGDITFPAFFIVVVFKMAANSRFVELKKRQNKSILVNILKSFLHGVRYVVFCTWFQRQPFWSENCFSLLKRQFSSSLCIIGSLYKVSPYNKQNISRWRGNMDFMFSWQNSNINPYFLATVYYPIYIMYLEKNKKVC